MCYDELEWNQNFQLLFNLTENHIDICNNANYNKALEQTQHSAN